MTLLREQHLKVKALKIKAYEKNSDQKELNLITSKEKVILQKKKKLVKKVYFILKIP